MPMPDVQVGLSAIERRRREDDAVMAALEEIARIGSIERAAKEAEARLALMRADEEAKKVELEELDAERARRLAALERDEAKARAAVSSQSEKASEILRDASERAAATVRDAKAAAQKVADETAAARLELANLKKDVDALTKVKDKAEKDINKLRERLVG